MNAHPNEAVVRRFHEAQARFYAGRGERGPVEALLTDDVEWHVPGRNAIAGHYRGRDEVLDYFARRRDHADDSFRIEVRQVLADDDLVVQLARGRAEIGGERREWETVGVFRVSDGRIAEGWLLPFDQYSFDEIWR